MLGEVEVKWVSCILEDCLDYIDVIRYFDCPEDNDANNQRAFLKKVLTATLEEIHHKRTFNVLNESLEEEEQKQLHFRNKQAKLAETFEKIAITKKAISQLKLEGHEQLDDLDKKEEESRLQLEDTALQCAQQVQFTRELCQHDVQSCRDRMAHEESCLQQEIEMCKKKIEMEMKINDTLETYLKETKMDLLNDIDTLKNRFQEDKRRNELQIQDLENQLDTLKNDIQELSDKCDMYAQTISEDKMQKMIAQQKIEEEIKLNRIIVHLQSWWRGIMVRKGLGLYAKRRKRKKTAKKETQEAAEATNTKSKTSGLAKPTKDVQDTNKKNSFSSQKNQKEKKK